MIIIFNTSSNILTISGARTGTPVHHKFIFNTCSNILTHVLNHLVVEYYLEFPEVFFFFTLQLLEVNFGYS